MNKWNVLLEDREEGFTVATVLEFRDIQIKDKTRQGAIEKVQYLLKQRLAKSEIVQISVEEISSNNNPLMSFAGIFKDDSDFEEVIAEIQAQREDK